MGGERKMARLQRDGKVRGERGGDATRGEKEDDEARKKQWGGEGDGWEREDAACHTGGRRGKNVG